MSRLEIPERAVDVALAENITGLRSGEAVLIRLEAAAPIIIAAYIRDRLMPDAEEVWLQAWLDMHARGLDPEGAAQ